MTYPAVNSTVATPWRQGTVVTVPPSIEPISLADAKLHLRIEPSDTWQDDHIDLLIVAARAKLEADLGFAVMAQTLRTDLSCFPSHPATYPAVWLGGGASVSAAICSAPPRVSGRRIHISPPERFRGVFPERLFGLWLLPALRRIEAETDIFHLFHGGLRHFPLLRCLGRPIVYSVVAGLRPDRPMACASISELG